MKHSILLLLLTAAFRLAGNSPAPEIAWEFDPAFGVKEQGLELNGFDSMKVLPGGNFKTRRKLEKGRRRGAVSAFQLRDVRPL